MRKVFFVKPGLRDVARPRRGIPSTVPCPRCHIHVKNPTVKHRNNKGHFCTGKVRRLRLQREFMIRIGNKLVRFDPALKLHMDSLRKAVSLRGLQLITTYTQLLANSRAAKALYADRHVNRPMSTSSVRDEVMSGSRLTKLQLQKLWDRTDRPKIKFGD